jgi:hypothetical protein
VSNGIWDSGSGRVVGIQIDDEEEEDDGVADEVVAETAEAERRGDELIMRRRLMLVVAALRLDLGAVEVGRREKGLELDTMGGRLMGLRGIWRMVWRGRERSIGIVVRRKSMSARSKEGRSSLRWIFARFTLMWTSTWLGKLLIKDTERLHPIFNPHQNGKSPTVTFLVI